MEYRGLGSLYVYLVERVELVVLDHTLPLVVLHEQPALTCPTSRSNGQA